MRYTLHQLRIFLKVVETKSVTKAAKELFMTQPAVSVQLRNFQQQFSIPLTEVIGRQLYVTNFGEEIAQLSEKVIEDVDAITYKTQAYEGVLTGKLAVSSASTGKYVIPYFLAEFVETHSGVDLVLDVTNKSRVVESLKHNEIDFALVSVLPEDVDIEEELLIDNKLYFVGNQPQKKKGKLLIYREEGSATRTAMEQHFKTVKKHHRKRIELTSNEAVKQAVVAGLGYSIMPLIGIQNELMNEQLHILPTRGLPLITQWRLIWLSGKKLSPVASAYLEFVRAEKERILRANFAWYLNY